MDTFFSDSSPEDAIQCLAPSWCSIGVAKHRAPYPALPVFELQTPHARPTTYLLREGAWMVPPGVKEEKRVGVDVWRVTVAFPLDDTPPADRADVYAFLPTEVSHAPGLPRWNGCGPRALLTRRRSPLPESSPCTGVPYASIEKMTRDTLKRGFQRPCTCACLQVHSGWPFLINADFLLTASRESIAFGTPWNQGLLGCTRAAFVEGYLEIQV